MESNTQTRHKGLYQTRGRSGNAARLGYGTTKPLERQRGGILGR